ncbi:hypothetical protein LTR85_001512 [Meristemomyces frigidus]|nr:hypothetical protein LTR85_001512 [Meristemomyces frigidus]
MASELADDTLQRALPESLNLGLSRGSERQAQVPHVRPETDTQHLNTYQHGDPYNTEYSPSQSVQMNGSYGDYTGVNAPACDQPGGAYIYDIDSASLPDVRSSSSLVAGYSAHVDASEADAEYDRETPRPPGSTRSQILGESVRKFGWPNMSMMNITHSGYLHTIIEDIIWTRLTLVAQTQRTVPRIIFLPMIPKQSSALQTSTIHHSAPFVHSVEEPNVAGFCLTTYNVLWKA